MGYFELSGYHTRTYMAGSYELMGGYLRLCYNLVKQIDLGDLWYLWGLCDLCDY